MKMSTVEELKGARTMEKALQILKMPEYLPFFEKANILQASALPLLREADLKGIGIDNFGRQKLLQAIRCLLKNATAKSEEENRIGSLKQSDANSEFYRIDEEEFYRQKAKNELSRCQMELNQKRNELARTQKHAKTAREIFEMVIDTRQQIEKLRKHSTVYDNLSIRELTINLEYFMNVSLASIRIFTSSKENVSPSLNTMLQPYVQKYQPKPVVDTVHDHNHRSHCLRNPTKPSSESWYTKILKPIANSRIDRHVDQHPTTLPCRIKQITHAVRHYNENNDKYYKAAASSPSTTPRSEYSNFVDGFFSKFGKNRTSTPCKQPLKQQRQQQQHQQQHLSNGTQHYSFVYHSRKKVRNVFTRRPRQ